MFFLAPIMLAGLAALAVPVVIHLLHRSRSEAMDWPTLRFLKVVRRQSARRSRLKNWLVLAARCLMLALIAVAMAKPYHTQDQWGKPPDLPTTLVLVLDNSYSMGYRESAGAAGDPEAGTRLARAKELALQQLAALALEDEAALVVANEQAIALTERPTRDLERVRKLIQAVKLSDRGTNLAPALTTAFALGQLDAAPAANTAPTEQPDADAPAPAAKTARKAWRHVMLFTDLQLSGFREVIEQKLLDKTAAPLPVTLVDLGDANARNRFIRQVRVRDQTAGGMLGVEVQVAGHADSAVGQQVWLWIDGQRAGAPQAIQPGSDKITLRAPLPAAGVHQCMVALDEDRLAIDDHAYFAINVTGGSSITLVDGDPSAVPALAETYFLGAALELIRARSNGLTLERLTPAQLSTASLKRGGGLILCNVPRLDGSALTRVENFLRGGGNVLVTLGDKVDIAQYNKDWHFLPIRLDRILGDPGRSRAYAILLDQANHPIFESVDLGATRFFAFIGSDPTALRSGGRVLASFSNGSPFLVEGVFGAPAPAEESGSASGAAVGGEGGRVVVMTGAIDADWSNLPYRRAFVPLADRLVAHLTRQRMTSRSIPLGQVVRFSGPGTLDRKTLTVSAPDGTTQTLTAALDAGSGAAIAEYRDTQSIGVYRVEADEGFAAGGGFAVNLDTRESILTPIDPEAISKAFGGHPLRIVRSAAGAAEAWNLDQSPELTQKRTEYWPWLLLAALGTFILETVLANVFTRRRRAQATPTTEYLGTRRTEAMPGGVEVR